MFHESSATQLWLLALHACECLRRHLRSGPEGVKSSSTTEEECPRLPVCSVYEACPQHLWGGRCGGDARACILASLIASGTHNVGFLSFLQRQFSRSLSAKGEAWGSLVPLFPGYFLFAGQWHLQWKTCWGSTWLRSDFFCSILPYTLTVKLPPIMPALCSHHWETGEVTSIWLTCPMFSHCTSHVTTEATLTKHRGVTW